MFLLACKEAFFIFSKFENNYFQGTSLFGKIYFNSRKIKSLLWVWYFISQKQPPEVLCKGRYFRNFTNFTGKHLCQSLSCNKVAGPGLQLYWRRDFGTCVFLWIFGKFLRTPFKQNTSGRLLLIFFPTKRQFNFAESIFLYTVVFVKFAWFFS